MINLETGLVQVNIKGRDIMVNFDVLLLGQDEAVLGMTWLREYNPKIDQITRQVEIVDTKG